MAFMSPVGVIVAEHPTVVIAVQKVIDESEIIFDHLACIVLPNLLTDRAHTGCAADPRQIIDHLDQAPMASAHQLRISQVGHVMPYLIYSRSRMSAAHFGSCHISLVRSDEFAHVVQLDILRQAVRIFQTVQAESVVIAMRSPSGNANFKASFRFE